ncbi:uncharacterized protein LOC111250477 [Varroa destructor]|uniref:Uncharacterized protein n=1 Tax=Varroa destructor TaxID=109461 RepID=A0A7M7K4X8_VARDE|nr:uncharacterized protein LOC111250477 [Varroa destructor]XP_022661541.1 uncharacterized protein LOC111250477 [Varroa destructor]
MIRRLLIALAFIGAAFSFQRGDPHVACYTNDQESEFIEWWNECTALCSSTTAPYNLTRVVIEGATCGPTELFKCRVATEDPVQDKVELLGGQGECVYEGTEPTKSWIQKQYSPVITCFEATSIDSFAGWVNECTVNCSVKGLSELVVQTGKPCGKKRNLFGHMKGRCRTTSTDEGSIGSCSC